MYKKTKDIKYPVMNFVQNVKFSIMLTFIDAGRSFST
jgi:hypothetical protein